MIGGLLVGEVLRGSQSSRDKLNTLALASISLIASGCLLHLVGICPIVKKIWTPSFALLSGGLAKGFLLLLYFVIDVRGYRRWAWPAVIVGMNSVAIYCMTYMLAEWVAKNLLTHLTEAPFHLLGTAYSHLLLNLTVGFCLWSICFWMYRRKIFLRI